MPSHRHPTPASRPAREYAELLEHNVRAFWLQHKPKHHSPSLSFSPGRSTSNLRGNLRSTASSRSKGLLVAPMTTTLSSTPAWLFSPSISCINSVMTPRCAMAPPESRADDLAPKSASISSRKTTQGDKRRARLKTALTSFSPSPTY